MRYVARGLGRRFQRGGASIAALDDLSFTLEPGGLVCVVGASGSGKTTLLQILGLVDTGYTGALTVDDRDVGGLAAAERARLRLARVGFVFQTFQLLDALTVLDNVMLPAWRLHGRRRADARARALCVELDLGHRLGQRPAELSVGELQRVAVARALVCDPAVVLADEPTANLDAANAARVLDALAAGAGAGRTVVVASHDPLVVARADRVLTLAYGRLQ
jgi:ABC-type lipoprotein export system ATPase subunit